MSRRQRCFCVLCVRFAFAEVATNTNTLAVVGANAEVGSDDGAAAKLMRNAVRTRSLMRTKTVDTSDATGEVHGEHPKEAHHAIASTKSTMVLQERENVVAQSLKSGHVLGQAPGGTATTSTSKNWFERVQESLFQFIFGIIAIIYSLPVLWFNEKRAAEMDNLFEKGKSDCKNTNGTQHDQANDGRLVHLAGEKTHAAALVQDTCFEEAVFGRGCVRLNRTVEIYQWVEQKTEQARDRLGGSRETRTTYSYHTEWSQGVHNSSLFHDKEKINSFKSWLRPGVEIRNCDQVNCGDAFVLPSGLVSQCERFVGVSDFPAKLTANEHQFTSFSEYYYCRPADNTTGGEAVAANSQVGDIRVKFTYVPDGVVTVVALQDPGKSDRATFLPYRVISRGLWGISKEEESKRLLIEGKKTRAELARGVGWTAGPLTCLCCACNCVAACIQGACTPEIYQLSEGSVPVDDCFDRLEATNSNAKWLGRLLGWTMMFLGLCGLFAPLVAVLAVIPSLAHVGSWIVVVASFFTTLLLSSLIVALAWLAYRPLAAVAYIAAAALVATLAAVKVFLGLAAAVLVISVVLAVGNRGGGTAGDGVGSGDGSGGGDGSLHKEAKAAPSGADQSLHNSKTMSQTFSL